MERLRVVQWSTGGVGSIAVRALAERSDCELVGVWVHDEAKSGQDAGALVGCDDLGIRATTDADALIGLAPDCVCYTPSGESRAAECIDDLSRLLENGINVVTTSVPGLVHPPAYDREATTRLEAAGRKGQASLYASGVEPGFAGDQLVLTLATLSHRIDTVRTQEIFSYADYPVPFTLFEVFGFGKPAEHRCIMEIPGVQASAWAPPVKMVADHLGASLDEIRETYEKRLTDERIEIAAGTIEAGTVGAVRFETIGVVDGREAIVIEHVNRIGPEVAPDWPSAERDGTYRILLEGAPSLRCDLVFGQPDGNGPPGDGSAQGMIATAMRVVNAIPAVCRAEPGLVSSMSLPPLLPPAPFGGRSPSFV